jgi:hypothetical protein
VSAELAAAAGEYACAARDAERVRRLGAGLAPPVTLEGVDAADPAAGGAPEAPCP